MLTSVHSPLPTPPSPLLPRPRRTHQVSGCWVCLPTAHPSGPFCRVLPPVLPACPTGGGEQERILCPRWGALLCVYWCEAAPSSRAGSPTLGLGGHLTSSHHAKSL